MARQCISQPRLHLAAARPQRRALQIRTTVRAQYTKQEKVKHPSAACAECRSVYPPIRSQSKALTYAALVYQGDISTTDFRIFLQDKGKMSFCFRTMSLFELVILMIWGVPVQVARMYLLGMTSPCGLRMACSTSYVKFPRKALPRWRLPL